MTTPAVIYTALNALAAQANTEHHACEVLQRGAVAHAIAAGEALIDAKSRLRHGEWLPWVDANCDFSDREAQNYMRIARNPRRVADLPSIRRALADLADPTPHPSPQRTSTRTLAPSLEPTRPVGKDEPHPDYSECWVTVPWVTECPCCGADLYTTRREQEAGR
jgi:hypothetical protein